MADDRVLVPGVTCWRVEPAEQFAVAIDAADYFRHCKAAMLRARQRIILIGWDFDATMAFERGGTSLPGPNQLAPFLHWLLWKRQSLQVYLLRSNLRLIPAFDDIWYGITPVSLANRLTSKRVHLAVDGAHPLGAVHHQKIVVVDDATAFCGGIDLTIERWDTSEHEDDSPHRRSWGRAYGPRHEVAAVVDGAAARALGDVARERWRTATGHSLPELAADHATWPRGLEPTLRDVDVAIARTLPEFGDAREVREIEALNLAAIASARHTVYAENQYLAARELVEALAARLAEPDGPEVVIVLPRRSESPLERSSMDSARERLIRVLWDADEHDRLGVYWPTAEAGTSVYVHSKVLVIDDQLLRVGSSNLNNRSLGFDSECDVAVEAAGDGDVAERIAAVRNGLVAEHLGVSAAEFTARVLVTGSLVKSVESFRGDGRSLQAFTETTVSDEASILAENDLMDPGTVPRSFARSVRRFIAGIADGRD